MVFFLVLQLRKTTEIFFPVKVYQMIYNVIRGAVDDRGKT